MAFHVRKVLVHLSIEWIQDHLEAADPDLPGKSTGRFPRRRCWNSWRLCCWSVAADTAPSRSLRCSGLISWPATLGIAR